MFGKISEEAAKELETIRKRAGGVLNPALVIEHAENAKSALHGYFTWEDTEAARLWRLHQARNVIRAVVHIIPQTEISSRVYVSLTGDRNEDGGYRAVVDVMQDEEARAIMLEEAKDELAAFRRKYAILKELSAVFEAIDKLESK